MSYFSRVEDLVTVPGLDVVINYDHICSVEDNWWRLVECVKGSRMEQTEQLHQEVTIALMGAYEKARLRLKANYRTAVPQYYNGKMQLLLPLHFRTFDTADAAITISLTTPQSGKEYYEAATILTKSMAYNNARLLAKPESEWLVPPR